MFLQRCQLYMLIIHYIHCFAQKNKLKITIFLKHIALFGKHAIIIDKEIVYYWFMRNIL